VAESKLILLANWTILDNQDGQGPHGSMGGCTDNLGQSWQGASGQNVMITPPTNGTIAGITSITCQTAFPAPPLYYGSPSTGTFGVLILHFFEVTGASPQDVVSRSAPNCSALPAPNQVTILADYTGVVPNGGYNASPILGDYGVPGPQTSGGLLLDNPNGLSDLQILNSIYATVGSSPATQPLQFPNATKCTTVTIPQSAPVETGVNLGLCDCPEGVAGQPINLTNGNVYIQQRDYSLPGLGGGITLDRMWNSLWPSAPHTNIPNVRMFGDSWTSNFEERVVPIDAYNADFWRADGSKYRFQANFVYAGVYYYSLQQPSFVAVQAFLYFDSNINQYQFTPGDNSWRYFDINGYPVSMKDRNGNTTNLTYDAQHRLIQVTDAAARSITFTYGDSANPNQATSVQDATGVIATYSYASGRMTQVAYADASFNRFTYDSNGLILSVTDTNGAVLESHTFDEYRRGLTSARANGAELVSVSYTADGVANLSDSVGHTTQYPSASFVGKNQVTGVSGPGCVSCGGRGNQTFMYNSYGQRTSSTDALNNPTQFTYDSNGNLASRSITVNGSAVTWHYTYDGSNQLLTSTDPLGHVTTNTYDSKENLLTTTTPSPGGKTLGSKTIFTYDSKGELLTITDPLLHVTTFTYTAAGLVATAKDAQNNVTQYQYDARGNRTAMVDALNQTTTFAYDARNRLTSVTYPTTPPTSKTFTYDSRGRRTSVTDPNGKTTTYAYDDADRLITVTDAQTPAGVTQYAYDSESNLVSITDALGLTHTTHYDHDQQGRVTKTTFPSGLIETYIYDALGNMTSKTDRNNQTITYTYDPLRRLTSKQYPDATQVQYTFDAASRLTQATDPTGTYQLTYDNMDRLTQTSTVYAFISGKTFPVGYAWDAGSNLTSMTDPQNGSTTYTYDTLNRLATLKDPQRNQFSFSYDALGRRTQLARPNSVDTNYQYDTLSRVTSLLHQLTGRRGTTTLDGELYSYDAAGNRLSRADQLTSIVSNYTYDPLYELTAVTQGANTTESYTFDAVGNRLSSLSASYTYDISNELTAQTGVTYTHDNNGNLTSKTDASGMTSYSWDFENRLTRITLPGGAQVNFKYDPNGRRIQKSSSSGTTNYVYDHANVLEEVDATGTLVTRYTQNLGTDEPLVTLKSGTTSYYEADALGTVTSLSNSSGALAKTYVYDSFGKLLSSSGTIANPYGFTGRELDSETGLMYYRARYYDPQIGRFISEDPIGFAGDTNFYLYVENDPENLTDLSGLCKDLDKQRKECEARILKALNKHFKTNFTSADITAEFQYSNGAPKDEGTLNLNMSGGGVTPGRFPVSWWTYAIGYGSTLHIPSGAGGLDSDSTLKFTNSQFTAHIDSSFPYNPIGFVVHALSLIGAEGYKPCP
jgi:RHS repeat-associated protein